MSDDTLKLEKTVEDARVDIGHLYKSTQNINLKINSLLESMALGHKPFVSKQGVLVLPVNRDRTRLYFHFEDDISQVLSCVHVPENVFIEGALQEYYYVNPISEPWLHAPVGSTWQYTLGAKWSIGTVDRRGDLDTHRVFRKPNGNSVSVDSVERAKIA